MPITTSPRPLMRWIGWCAALVLVACSARAAEPPSAHTDGLDLGVQPHTTTHFIAMAMRHDQLLQRALRQSGLRLRTQSFQKGSDMLAPLAQGHLDAAFLGNLPSTQALVSTPSVLIGLATQNYVIVVARVDTQLHQLRGRRVAYPHGTSAHFGVMRALEAAQIAASELTLVPMNVSQMPEALARGEIDAFCAWEPTPSRAPALTRGARIIHRSISTHWLMPSRRLIAQHPNAALALTASYARAVIWMRQHSAHLAQAAHWVHQDTQRFNDALTGAANGTHNGSIHGASASLPVHKTIALARQEILHVPGMPLLPQRLDGAPPLLRELHFLQAQGLLRDTSAGDTLATLEARVRAAVEPALLAQVLKAPLTFQIHRFDYRAPPP